MAILLQKSVYNFVRAVILNTTSRWVLFCQCAVGSISLFWSNTSEMSISLHGVDFISTEKSSSSTYRFNCYVLSGHSLMISAKDSKIATSHHPLPLTPIIDFGILCLTPSPVIHWISIASKVTSPPLPFTYCELYKRMTSYIKYRRHWRRCIKRVIQFSYFVRWFFTNVIDASRFYYI